MLIAWLLLCLNPIPSESRQMVWVTSEDWSAVKGEARLFERTSARHPWEKRGRVLPVSLGHSGMGWGRGLHDNALPGPRKVEGDGRAPAGVFFLLAAMGYDPAPRVKINLPYRHLTADLYCVDDPASRHYNQIVNGETVVRDWKSAEPMRRPDNLYRLLIVVGHNVDPIEPGQGSCLFIHLRRNPPAPTAGCTALEDAALRELLLWLRSDQRPVLVQLPRVVSQQLARGWGLPRP